MLSGTGSCTIAKNDDGSLTMTEQIHARIDVSGSCNDNTQRVLLTPATG